MIGHLVAKNYPVSKIMLKVSKANERGKNVILKY